jgi:UPF0716 protein FxsA
VGRRVRLVAAAWVLAELAVFVAVAAWIGVGWTILATLATSALGAALLSRQGTRALAELQERARTRQHPGRALGDAGLVAVGGLLMLLPGFLGDLIGLLCLLPGTRAVPRALLGRIVVTRLPGTVGGPVRVRSARTGEVRYGDGDGDGYGDGSGHGAGAARPAPLVIEGEVVREEPVEQPRRTGS